MNQHPVGWENLIDWLDGQLEPQAARQLEEHLEAGCPSCEASLAWLRRFRAASVAADTEEPPLAVVRRAKAVYATRQRRPRWLGRAWWPARLPRLAPVLGALLAVILLAAYLFQTPVVFARQAVLAMAEGTVQAGPAGADWQGIAAGARVGEGDRVRVVDGEAALTLFDGSRLELQPGAEVALSSLRSGPPGGAYRVAVYQQAGAVRYDVPALGHPRSGFYVESPTARISVQGTTFIVVVDSAGETRVTVLRGSVSAAGALDSVLLGEHQGAVIRARARVRLVGDAAPSATRTSTPGGRATQAPGPPPTQGPARGKTPQPGHGGQGSGEGPRRSSTPTSPPAQATETPGRAQRAGPTATRQTPGPTRTSTATSSPGRTQ